MQGSITRPLLGPPPEDGLRAQDVDRLALVVDEAGPDVVHPPEAPGAPAEEDLHGVAVRHERHVDHHHPPGPSCFRLAERALHRAPVLAGLPDVLVLRHPEGVAEHDDVGGRETVVLGAVPPRVRPLDAVAHAAGDDEREQVGERAEPGEVGDDQEVVRRDEVVTELLDAAHKDGEGRHELEVAEGVDVVVRHQRMQVRVHAEPDDEDHCDLDFRIVRFSWK